MDIKVVYYGDWAAIFKDGKQIHWHDLPSVADFCHMVSIPCETFSLDELIPDEQECQEFAECMANTWDEFQDRLKEIQLAAKRKEVEQAKNKLALLEQECAELESNG